MASQKRPHASSLAGFSMAMLSVLVTVAGFPLESRAQQSQSDTADPSTIERRLEETRPKAPERAPRSPTVPEAEPEVSREEVRRFVLSAVVIEGATAIDRADLAPLYEEFLAESIASDEAALIAERITQAYREAGYVLSRAVVPPQQVRGGILRIRVIEGYISRVEFNGAEGQKLDVYAERLSRVRPVTLAALERYVLLIDDLNGLDVQDSAVSRLDAEGAYLLTLTVEYDAVDAYMYSDNRGTPEVGRLQTWASVGANSILGRGERLQLGVFTVPDDPDELKYGEVQYHQPVGGEGTQLSTTVSGSRIDAGGDLAAQNTESSSARVVARLTHPIMRRRDHSLWAAATFDVLNVEEDRFGRSNFDDRLRVLRARMTYRRRHHQGTTSLTLEASQGLDVLNASEEGSSRLSRFDGESTFTKVHVRLQRTQGLGPKSGLQIAATGQKSADPLLSAEEFALGGSQFGRAFDFFELSGEDGVAGSLELRFGEQVRHTVLRSYQMYAFLDAGTVWNRNAPDRLESQSLSSVGAGIRVNLAHGQRATLEVAQPLLRDVDTTGERDPRAFFTLSMSF